MSNLALLWFSGITWETKIGDIGWTYVVEVLLVISLIRIVLQIRRIGR